MKTQITNDFDALVQALTLAITAPSNEKAQEVIAIADSLIHGMDELEVARAKKIAMENVK